MMRAIVDHEHAVMEERHGPTQISVAPTPDTQRPCINTLLHYASSSLLFLHRTSGYIEMTLKARSSRRTTSLICGSYAGASAVILTLTAFETL
jgi:hypothetical protein